MLLDCGSWEKIESPSDCKDIKPISPKGDQSWIFIGRTDAEVETPILWQPDAKSWLIWKDPNAGKDWRQEKGTTEDEMVGLSGLEFQQASGVGDGQGSLACCNPWGHRVGHTWVTKRNWQVALVVKILPDNPKCIRDVCSVPGSRRFPGGGNGNPLQYSCLENPHG